MAKPPVAPTATEQEVRALLERYHCPVLFHEVRTRCLGNIASPGNGISPIKLVEGLWGGKLPDFGSTDAAKDLSGTRTEMAPGTATASWTTNNAIRSRPAFSNSARR